MRRLAWLGLVALLGVSLSSCATSEERKRARAERLAEQARCPKETVPTEERLPRVRAAMTPFIGRSEQEVFTILHNCKLRGDPGRVAKYRCRFRYDEGCTHPNSNVTVVFTDGLLSDWVLDR